MPDKKHGSSKETDKKNNPVSGHRGTGQKEQDRDRRSDNRGTNR